MGQVTIKTAKKLAAGNGVSEAWYPLQPSKSGKAASGALKIKLKVVKKSLTLANLQKKKSGFINPEADIFQMIRNHDLKGVETFLETASEDDVNRQEEKTGNTPLHAACLEAKNLTEDVFWALLRVRLSALHLLSHVRHRLGRMATSLLTSAGVFPVVPHHPRKRPQHRQEHAITLFLCQVAEPRYLIVGRNDQEGRLSQRRER
jgi:hypothetical protein